MLLNSKTVTATTMPHTLPSPLRVLRVTYTPHNWVVKLASVFHFNLQPSLMIYDISEDSTLWIQRQPYKKELSKAYSSVIEAKYQHVQRQQELLQTTLSNSAS